MRILQIEDQESDIQLTRRWLRGADIDVAKTFQAGIKLFQRNEYDLILLDLRLPDTVDPWDTIRRAEHELHTCTCPIIVLSAERLMRGLHPFTDFVSKGNWKELQEAATTTMFVSSKDEMLPLVADAIEGGF